MESNALDSEKFSKEDWDNHLNKLKDKILEDELRYYEMRKRQYLEMKEEELKKQNKRK